MSSSQRERKPYKKANKKPSPGKYEYKYKKRELAARTKRENQDRPAGVISAAGSAIGGLLGSEFGPVGVAFGSFLGGKLGHLTEKVTGFGDYKVSQNSIMKGGMSHPQIVNSVETGSTIIRYREYLTDIYATTDFAVQTFIINPGMSDTFPWMSQIANSYEQYRLRGVLFEFNSTSSDAVLSTATSSALGTITMQTDYDVADPAPTSKRQMLNSLFACSEKPSQSFIHPIECKKSLSAQNILYTRTSGVPAGYDPRLYDFAKFNIATEGMQAAGGTLGELWVTYEIELFKQQYNPSGLIDHLYFTNVTVARALGTALNPQNNLARGATLGGTLDANGQSYRFPPSISSGKFLVCYSVSGSITSAVIPASIDSVTNGSLLNFFGLGLTNFVASPNPAAGGSCMMRTVVVQINKAGASIVFNLTNGNPPTGNVGELWVTRIPDSLVALPS